MTKNKRVIFTVLLAVVIIFILAYVYFFDKGYFAKSTTSKNTDQTAGVLKANEVKEVKTDTKAILKHEKPNFTLEYPADFVVSKTAIDGGETVVFKKPAPKSGFQIFISPYAEKAGLNSVIQAAFPDLPIEGMQEVVIGDNIHALIFWSSDPSIGKTRELWFVRDGYLFQVTAYPELDSLLAEIFAASLKFTP